MGKLIRGYSISMRSLVIITDKNILEKIEMIGNDVAIQTATVLVCFTYMLWI